MNIKHLLSLSLGALTVLGAGIWETQKANAAAPWRLTQTFVNPTPEEFDLFGFYVSISGNNVLIGAPDDSTGTDSTGTAYLFDGTTGRLTHTFLNPTPEAFDNFGNSVSINGNNVLIGAPDYFTRADGAGAAYLFDGTTGSLLQTFFNPTPEEYDYFGNYVSISGNNVLIGAFGDNTGADDAGAAYLFDGTTGALTQTFLNPTPEAFDSFGSVSISGNNVLIGAYVDSTGAAGAGAAYLFDGTTGALTQTFFNPTPEEYDYFGNYVSISGNNVLIGAFGDNTGADDAGAAYLFDGTTGALTQTFLNPTPEAFDSFGFYVSISGNNVLIGAPYDNTGADNAGAAYLFDGTTGALTQTFLNPTPEVVDYFGISVSISGNNVLIGARNDNTGATNAGAAYLYQPIPEPFTILGGGTAIAFGAFYKRKLTKKRP